MNEKLQFALRPDAQAFDEVRIRTIPRYKESELSGDEWRIHAEIEFYRKGKKICSTGVGKLETACGMVYAKLMEAMDNGQAYYAGDGKMCDQEGCSKEAKFIYRIKQSYNRDGQKTDSYTGYHRCFCDEHKTRGDCGLEDADDNYEMVGIV